MEYFENITAGHGWPIAVTVAVAIMFISLAIWRWCCIPKEVPLHMRRPGYPKEYTWADFYDPNRPPDHTWISYPYSRPYDNLTTPWGYPFYLDFKDPESLSRELKKHGMAGVLVLPMIHAGKPGGPGKLLLTDDNIKTSDLGDVDGIYKYIAVYPDDVLEAAYTISSPRLKKLMEPYPNGSKTACNACR